MVQNPQAQPVLVTLDDRALGRFTHVVDELRKAGLEVEIEMDKIGVVKGVVSPEKKDGLRKVQGVLSVEPEQQVWLSPPL